MEINSVLYDSTKNIIVEGEFNGSIITKCNDEFNSIIFSDNITISKTQGISITQGLNIGFEIISKKKSAFSRKIDKHWQDDFSSLEYSVLIPPDIMEFFDEGTFSDTFPNTVNLLHTAGLYLDGFEQEINHLEFFKGEIIKDPICLIMNGIIVSDRVVIDDSGDPVFYDCIIVGRNEKEDLSVSFEPLTNVKKTLANVNYIIILGSEELKL